MEMPRSMNDFTTPGSAGSPDVCPTCGLSTKSSAGLQQFLGRLGLSDEMVNKLTQSFAKVDVDEYLDTARDYLKNSSEKATSYVKEHPGQVAAGVAVLAVGTALLVSALKE
jgi:hypothetical protein